MALRAKERSIHVVWRTARRESEAAVNVFDLLASARGCNQILTPASQTHTQTPSAGSWLKKWIPVALQQKTGGAKGNSFGEEVCVCVCVWAVLSLSLSALMCTLCVSV